MDIEFPIGRSGVVPPTGKGGIEPTNPPQGGSVIASQEKRHLFQVVTGEKDTILFCVNCGLSYLLTLTCGRAYWQEIRDFDHNPREIPPCR